MVIIGFVLAIVIGVLLGLIGGGGSILTVPVFNYLMGVDAVTATAYSLFVVGISSFFGALRFMQNKLVEYKTAVVFAIPSFISVWLTRSYLIPAIPSEITQIGSFTLTKDVAIMLFFALIMVVSSFSMIKNKKLKTENIEDSKPVFNYPMILVEGAVVGVITGIVGAGGGFLIIPALVVLAKLPMKLAVGTSLIIIAVKSLIGFTGDLSNPDIHLDWTTLLVFSGLAVVGIFTGIELGKKIPGEKLKKAFGYFVLVSGILIILEKLL